MFTSPTSHPPGNQRRPRGCPAFTLIELLVVITIIGVLAGISLPVYNSIQQNARSTQCLSNLRQLGAATFAFAGEHDQKLPNYTDPTANGIPYPQYLWPYVYTTPYISYSGSTEPANFIGTVFHCPLVSTDVQAAAKLIPPITVTNYSSYGMNYWLGDGDPTTPELLSNVPHITSTMLLCDNYNSTQAQEANLAPRHLGFCNVVFCDGHSEKVVITASMRGVNGTRKDPFWGDRSKQPNQ